MGSFEFPWQFAAVTTCFTIVLMWYFLYASTAMAMVLRAIINYRLGKESKFGLGSLSLALLGGKVLLGNVKFRSKDITLNALSVAITLKWWKTRVKTPDSLQDRSLSFRLLVHAVGLEVFISSNSSRYDALQCFINKQTPDGAQAVSIDLNKIGLVVPRLYPVVKFLIEDSAIMIGNAELPSFLVVSVRAVDGVHMRYKPRSPDNMAPVRNVTTADIRQARVYLQKNMEPNSFRSLLDMKQKMDQEDFLSVAMHGVQQFLSEVKGNIASGVGLGRDDLPIQQHQFQPQLQRRIIMLGKAIQAAASPNNVGSPGRTGNAFAFDLPPDAGTTDKASESDSQVEVLQCARMSLSYFFDEATVIQEWISLEDEHEKSPEFGIDITCDSPAVIVYGAWVEHQRILLQSTFLPFAYRHAEVYTPRLGDLRRHVTFSTRIRFQSDSKLKVLYQRPGNASTAELYVVFKADSTLTVLTPWYPLHSDGSAMVVEATFREASIVPSFTGSPLVDCTQLELKFNMHWPVRWNDPYNWHFLILFIGPSVFFLKDHLQMISEISSHWSSFARKIELDWFMPTCITLDIGFTDLQWFWNVNENNVVNKCNDMKDNAHILTRSPGMTILVRLPWMMHDAPTAEIDFSVMLQASHWSLLLPDCLELFSQNQTRFLTCMKFSLDGKYKYGYHYHADFRDSFSTHLHMQDSQWNIDGHYLRYILSLNSNYFGETQSIIKLGDFQEQQQNLISKKRQWAYYTDSAEPVNSFESNQRRPVMRLFDLNLELRVIEEYLDLTMSCSPITLTVPVVDPPEQPYTIFHHKNAGPNALEQETYYRFTGLAVRKQSHYGPSPFFFVKRSDIDVTLDSIHGQLITSQLAALLSSFGVVGRQYSDSADERLMPDLSKRVLTEEQELWGLCDHRTSVKVTSVAVDVVDSSSIARLRLRRGFDSASSSLVTQEHSYIRILYVPEYAWELIAVTKRSSTRHRSKTILSNIASVSGIGLDVVMTTRHGRWEPLLKKQREFLSSSIGFEEDGRSLLAERPWLRTNANASLDCEALSTPNLHIPMSRDELSEGYHSGSSSPLSRNSDESDSLSHMWQPLKRSRPGRAYDHRFGGSLRISAVDDGTFVAEKQMESPIMARPSQPIVTSPEKGVGVAYDPEKGNSDSEGVEDFYSAESCFSDPDQATLAVTAPGQPPTISSGISTPMYRLAFGVRVVSLGLVSPPRLLRRILPVYYSKQSGVPPFSLPDARLAGSSAGVFSPLPTIDFDDQLKKLTSGLSTAPTPSQFTARSRLEALTSKWFEEMMSGFETEGPPANNDPTLAELDCVQVKTHIDVLSPVSVDVHLDAVRALSIMMSSMKLRNLSVDDLFDELHCKLGHSTPPDHQIPRHDIETTIHVNQTKIRLTQSSGLQLSQYPGSSVDDPTSLPSTLDAVICTSINLENVLATTSTHMTSTISSFAMSITRVSLCVSVIYDLPLGNCKIDLVNLPQDVVPIPAVFTVALSPLRSRGQTSPTERHSMLSIDTIRTVMSPSAPGVILSVVDAWSSSVLSFSDSTKSSASTNQRKWISFIQEILQCSTTAETSSSIQEQLQFIRWFKKYREVPSCIDIPDCVSVDLDATQPLHVQMPFTSLIHNLYRNLSPMQVRRLRRRLQQLSDKLDVPVLPSFLSIIEKNRSPETPPVTVATLSLLACEFASAFDKPTEQTFPSSMATSNLFIATFSATQFDDSGFQHSANGEHITFCSRQSNVECLQTVRVREIAFRTGLGLLPVLERTSFSASPKERLSGDPDTPAAVKLATAVHVAVDDMRVLIHLHQGSSGELTLSVHQLNASDGVTSKVRLSSIGVRSIAFAIAGNEPGRSQGVAAVIRSVAINRAFSEAVAPCVSSIAVAVESLDVGINSLEGDSIRDAVGVAFQAIGQFLADNGEHRVLIAPKQPKESPQTHLHACLRQFTVMLTKGDDLSLDYKLDKVVMNMYSAGESSSGHFVAFGSDDTPHALTVSAPGLKHSQKLPTIHIEFANDTLASSGIITLAQLDYIVDIDLLSRVLQLYLVVTSQMAMLPAFMQQLSVHSSRKLPGRRLTAKTAESRQLEVSIIVEGIRVQLCTASASATASVSNVWFKLVQETPDEQELNGLVVAPTQVALPMKARAFADIRDVTVLFSAGSSDTCSVIGNISFDATRLTDGSSVAVNCAVYDTLLVTSSEALFSLQEFLLAYTSTVQQSKMPSPKSLKQQANDSAGLFSVAKMHFALQNIRAFVDLQDSVPSFVFHLQSFDIDGIRESRPPGGWLPRIEVLAGFAEVQNFITGFGFYKDPTLDEDVVKATALNRVHFRNVALELKGITTEAVQTLSGTLDVACPQISVQPDIVRLLVYLMQSRSPSTVRAKAASSPTSLSGVQHQMHLAVRLDGPGVCRIFALDGTPVTKIDLPYVAAMCVVHPACSIYTVEVEMPKLVLHLPVVDLLYGIVSDLPDLSAISSTAPNTPNEDRPTMICARLQPLSVSLQAPFDKTIQTLGTISVEQPVLFCSMKAPTGSSWLESSTLSVPQMSALVSSSRKERFLEFSVSGILLQSSTMSSAKARTVSVSNIHAVIDLGYYQLFDSLISQFRNRWKLLSSQNSAIPRPAVSGSKPSVSSESASIDVRIGTIQFAINLGIVDPVNSVLTLNLSTLGCRAFTSPNLLLSETTMGPVQLEAGCINDDGLTGEGDIRSMTLRLYWNSRTSDGVTSRALTAEMKQKALYLDLECHHAQLVKVQSSDLDFVIREDHQAVGRRFAPVLEVNTGDEMKVVLSSNTAPILLAAGRSLQKILNDAPASAVPLSTSRATRTRQASFSLSIPVGKVKVHGEKFECDMLTSGSNTDGGCLAVIVVDFRLSFGMNVDDNMRIHRDCTLDVGVHQRGPDDEWIPVQSSLCGVYLLRLSANQAGDILFEIPGFVLESITLQSVGTNRIVADFVTFWDKAIIVPVHMSYYKLITETALEYVTKLNEAYSRYASPKTPTARLSRNSTASQPKMIIQTNEMVLNPQIHLLGNFTPPDVVAFVLNRFGVQRESIPDATYSVLTANLQTVLSAVTGLVESIDSRISNH
ncbi:unnamed protein product (mitochondrion) [Plasmodiophora brassicae]|uniref:FMP27 GFWDK domain-containing protein n=1 Tax=Plasmodiophora brassicae TaxID=37360 RepID=A0A3P3Y8G6_PLABS|nr:unnamed protein product [Plasmodiophora brassicae]